MSMNHKLIFLSFAVSLMANSINVFARSIDTTGETNATVNQKIINLPAIVCIVGVVAVVASGGFCLFSKKHKRPSEEYLTKENSISNTSSSSSSSGSPNSSNSELRQLNKENEEVDITVKVDKMDGTENKVKSEEVDDAQPKRRSILDSILNRNPKKDRRSSNIQFKDDRSLNSISTNEDWINEQKLQADNQDELFDDDDEDLNSNDGFWNSDLQPIQSSSDNNPQSYGVPSLGKRNSVIVKSGSRATRQSAIIIDDSEKTTEAEDKSEKSVELRPTRVKSWKNNDYDKELKEILKNMEDEDQSISK